MYDGKSVAVVVPAYNEEALIASTVSTIPAFVDRIIVVDDASTDGTVEKVKGADTRVDLVVHERNQGVGAAIVTGYKRAIAEDIEITAVMAAHGQMDPRDPQTAVAAATPTGYTRATAEAIEITAVMAAAGQMDPDDLETLVQGISVDEVHYA